MGLDQYGMAKSPEGEVSEIAYWRKFNSLHGWMEVLWKAKMDSETDTQHGGTGLRMGKRAKQQSLPPTFEFNGEPVELNKTDLEMLELAVKARALPETSGFFFGSPAHERSDYDQLLESVLDFIREAREYLAKDYEIAYNSWW